MALTQETVVATQVERQRYGYQAISLTNFGNTSEPQIAAGSRLEIGGALFYAGSAESLTGWAGIANSSDVYMKLAVSGASATASFTTTAPAWDTAKQGWYDGSDRYIGGLYKDSGGNYTLKWLYEEKQVLSLKRYGTGAVRFSGAITMDSTLGVTGIATATGGVDAGASGVALKAKVVQIGDWNMDTTDHVAVALGITGSKYRGCGVVLFSDGAQVYSLPCFSSAGAIQAWVSDATLASGSLTLYRLTGGTFDNSSFDSTSYNRGYVTVWYEP